MSCCHSRTVLKNFDDSVSAVTEALKKEGFGVLTQIDMAAKLKEKLGVNFHKYVILGACNPSLTYQALQAENKIAAMLPCSVIVQGIGPGHVSLAAIDPSASMAAVGNPALESIAAEVSERLRRVVESI